MRAEIAELGESLSADFRSMRAWTQAEHDLLRFRPRPGAWTIAQILEHVTLANRFLLILVDKISVRARKRVARGDEVPAAAPRFDHIEAPGRRSFAWAHPEHMTPTDAADPDLLRARLEQQERQCLEFLAQMPDGEGSLHRIRMSLLGSERLDLYQYLYFLGVHLRRHLAQIEANRELWSQADEAS